MEELLSKVVVFIAIFAMALWYAATLVAVFLSIYYDNQKEEKDPQGGG